MGKKRWHTESYGMVGVREGGLVVCRVLLVLERRNYKINR